MIRLAALFYRIKNKRYKRTHTYYHRKVTGLTAITVSTAVLYSVSWHRLFDAMSIFYAWMHFQFCYIINIGIFSRQYTVHHSNNYKSAQLRAFRREVGRAARRRAARACSLQGPGAQGTSCSGVLRSGPADIREMIHNLYIFNRQGACLYYEEWNRPHYPLSDDPGEDRRLMFGILFSLKQFSSKMSPRPYVHTFLGGTIIST